MRYLILLIYSVINTKFMKPFLSLRKRLPVTSSFNARFFPLTSLLVAFLSFLSAGASALAISGTAEASSSSASAASPSFALTDKTFGGSGYDSFSAIIKTSDGGFLYGGSSASGAGGDKTEANKTTTGEWSYDYWIVKVNADGVKQWDRTYGGASYDGLTTLIQTTDGGYLLGGYSWSGAGADKAEASRGESDFWVVKINGSGQKEWDRTYGGTDHDYLISALQTADGGYLLGGHSLSEVGADKSAANRGEGDYWVVKVSKSGQKEWDRAYGGPGFDWLSAVVPSAGGGYLLTGSSDSGIGGEKSEGRKGNTQYWEGKSDFWVVKISSTGTKEWDRSFGGSGRDVLKAAVSAADGGYLLGGTSDSWIGNKTYTSQEEETDYWVVKISSTGTQAWDRAFGGDDVEDLAALVSTADGGYLLGGSSYSGAIGDKTGASRGGSDYWVVKVNASGTKEWDRASGGNGNDDLKSLVQTPGEDYLLGGNSNSEISGEKTAASRGEYDFWLVRLAPKTSGETATGTILREYWANAPGTQVSAIPVSRTPTSTSQLTVFEAPANIGDSYGTRIRGYVHAPKTGDYTFWVAGDDHCELWLSTDGNPANKRKIASVGSYTASREWNKFASQKSQPVRLEAGKRYYVEVLHKENTGKDHVAVGWQLPGGALERPISGKHLSPFVLTGTTGVSQALQVLEEELPLPGKPSLSVYPNPFTDRTTLQFVPAETGRATVEVYDLKGNLMRRLFTEPAEAGTQQTFELEGSGMAQGIYLVRLVSGRQVVKQKIVLSK